MPEFSFFFGFYPLSVFRNLTDAKWINWRWTRIGTSMQCGHDGVLAPLTGLQQITDVYWNLCSDNRINEMEDDEKGKKNYFFLPEWVHFSRCWNRIWLSGESRAWLFSLCFKGKPDYRDRLHFLLPCRKLTRLFFFRLKKHLESLMSNHWMMKLKITVDGERQRVRFTESIMWWKVAFIK